MSLNGDYFLAAHWPKCIVGPGMECHHRESDGPAELLGGVYFLFDGAALVYVGHSGYVRQRIGQHRAQRSFTRWGSVPVPHPLLAPIESAYIAALRPPQNAFVPVMYDSLQEKIVAAILAAWKVSASGGVPSDEECSNAGINAEN